MTRCEDKGFFSGVYTCNLGKNTEHKLSWFLSDMIYLDYFLVKRLFLNINLQTQIKWKEANTNFPEARNVRRSFEISLARKAFRKFVSSAGNLQAVITI